MKKYIIYGKSNEKNINDCRNKIVFAKSKKEALKYGFIGNCYNDIDLIGKASLYPEQLQEFLNTL